MDRRVIWAIALMMVIAIAPTFFFKPPPKRPAASSRPDSAAPAPAPQTGGPGLAGQGPEGPVTDSGPVTGAAPTPAAPAETLLVSSELYRYSFSTRGGAIAQAEILKYPNLAPGEKGRPVDLLPDDTRMNQLSLLVGRDTLPLAEWDFVPSARQIEVAGEETLSLAATRGGVSVELQYHFRPDDYEIGISGRVVGLGPVGGHLLIDMGHGLRQTEADSAGNFYEFGVVTKTDESKLVKFSSLKPGISRTLEGPYEWAAVKSKYFVAALLAVDSGAARISGATLEPPAAPEKVTRAEVTFGLPVGPSGEFSYRLYAGPMEYPRLKAVGHDFYDINPYGWPGFRTLIRPIAVGARWLLVWMHQHLSLAYGVVLILFGVMIRLVLWPLNQKGMRASLRMQALQPEMQRIQEQYKNDPQKLQQEVMQLYRREGVNPLSGCWPLLLPWPVLLALFFVFQNTIELRGQAFLWLPDLSLKDPLFILPVLMGLSMFGLNKVGMSGMPPTPQTKMMLYFLPIMMTVFFVNFASGLNLYYFVQNLASIPQQFLIARERARARQATAPPPPAPAATPRKRKDR